MVIWMRKMTKEKQRLVVITKRDGEANIVDLKDTCGAMEQSSGHVRYS